MKKVLLIAYYFPPMGGGGVLRITKFAKYLPKYGWEPIALTVKEKTYYDTGRSIDKTLLEELPKGMEICRTRSIDLCRASQSIKRTDKKIKRTYGFKSIFNTFAGLFINPDAQMFWIPTGVINALKLIEKHKIDIIFSTGNPWSDHIIGAFSKRITNLPLITDYRDPWNVKPYVALSSRFRTRIQLFLEREVIKLSDKVILATEGMQSDYSDFFRNEKFVTIRNGYDPNDFREAKPKTYSHFTILYSGSIWQYRRPKYLLTAIAKWLDKKPQIRNKVRMNFIGSIDEETRKMIRKEKLLDVVNFLGYIPHKECIKHMVGSDVLLLIIDEGGDQIITGKIFEYLASGRHILAVIPPTGNAAMVLRREGRDDFIVEPRDVDGIIKALDSLFMKYREKRKNIRKTIDFSGYTREKACIELVKIFNELSR